MCLLLFFLIDPNGLRTPPTPRFHQGVETSPTPRLPTWPRTCALKRTSFGRTGLEWEHLIDRFLQTSLAVVQKSTLSGIVNRSRSYITCSITSTSRYQPSTFPQPPGSYDHHTESRWKSPFSPSQIPYASFIHLKTGLCSTLSAIFSKTIDDLRLFQSREITETVKITLMRLFWFVKEVSSL